MRSHSWRRTTGRGLVAVGAANALALTGCTGGSHAVAGASTNEGKAPLTGTSPAVGQIGRTGLPQGSEPVTLDPGGFHDPDRQSLLADVARQ